MFSASKQNSPNPLLSSGAAYLLDQATWAHCSAACFVKRCIDILGALVGLTLTLPVAMAVAIANSFDSPGPLFYCQTRSGLAGRPFKMWKFRSMVTNADQIKHLVANQAKGLVFKNTNDPRVTRVGRFLRKTSLDELPQFWNVLMGDMSLVGTRPPTFDEVERYQPHHWDRLRVKPGMTGEWQVNGRSNVQDFEDIVKMDVDYQSKWSIAYDLRLIAKTVWVVLAREGAC
ncbi:MAG: sugar transferase [Elainellaceae cyanobacterium]